MTFRISLKKPPDMTTLAVFQQNFHKIAGANNIEKLYSTIFFSMLIAQ